MLVKGGLDCAPMGSPKITPALDERIRAEADDRLLDVVVELAGDAPEGGMPELRQAFRDAAAPVEERIARAGGEVLDGAWLNRTLRAKVPAARLRELGDLDQVAALDVPHRVTPD